MEAVMDYAIFGEADPGAVSQMETCMRTADRGALMADHHKGYAVPIGGVLAYKDKVSPSGVGFDIGCGNKAVRTDADASYVQEHIEQIMDEVWRRISFGIGQKNETRVDHELFDFEAWKLPSTAPIKDKAHAQLGTVGSGNHYVDIFKDEDDHIWIGVHFGSRGLGHGIATYYLKAGGAKDGMDVEPLVLDAHGALGSEYVAAMKLAGAYAYAGRDWVCAEVARILGAEILEEVHNHHNYAWVEEHDGEQYYVVRKGATPAFPGQKGFVGATMGEKSVILEGVDSPIHKETLYSTVHGAGRKMSRTAAKGKKGQAGLVSRDMMLDWVREQKVELRGAGVDESPHCYKRLNGVLAFHLPTVKILHMLTPLGVAMAGHREYDPYRD